MNTYVTKSLYIGEPIKAKKLLDDIDAIRGDRSFHKFVIEAIQEKIIREKSTQPIP